MTHTAFHSALAAISLLATIQISVSTAMLGPEQADNAAAILVIGSILAAYLLFT